MVDHVAAQVVKHRLGVPHRLGQQPLHPLRCSISSLLRQPPRRPGIHILVQTKQKRAGLSTGLNTLEPARHPDEQSSNFGWQV